MNPGIYLSLLIMCLTVYCIRMLPFLVFRKEITNRWLRSFLYYVPYVTLAVMTFPAIVTATDNIWSGIAALIVGLILSGVIAGLYLRSDMTANKAVTLNPALTDVIQSMDKDVTVSALYTRKTENSYLTGVLAQLSRIAKNVTVEQIDPSSGQAATLAAKTGGAELADGSVVVGFTFDGAGLAGRSIVAFETVTCEGKEVFVHADLDDRDQTVNFPEVRTNATDMKDGDHEISYEGTVTVVDSVEYRNLTPGVKYLVSGVLMDKSAGKAANAGGEITGETEFTAKEKDGTVKVSFNFDSTKLKEGSYVVFETLYEINDKTGEKHVVGTHWDLEDDAQTVSRPKTPTPPGTSARTGDDSSMAVWAIALTAAFAGLAGAVIYGRKRFGR